MPDWSTLSDTIAVAPWAKELAELVLKQPMGEWFMSVAAGLEYMYSKVDASAAAAHDDDDDRDEDSDAQDDMDSEEEKEARAREEAGADWMEAQGFDRKD
jgi:hypothetical protein